MQTQSKNANLRFRNLLSPKKIGRFMLNVFLILPGIFFLFTGFQWLVAPESAASALMMPLLAGGGLGSQIADIGGLFMGMGLLVMGAVTTRKGDLLFSVALILSCIAVYRLLAFSLHDATLSMQSVVFEMVLAIWFLVASRMLPVKEPENA
jgi:Co/Zn/Cd efflux system component